MRWRKGYVHDLTDHISDEPPYIAVAVGELNGRLVTAERKFYKPYAADTWLEMVEKSVKSENDLYPTVSREELV